MNNGSIGLGLVTCNRLSLFARCVESIPKLDKFIIVNDGSAYPDRTYPSSLSRLVQHSSNRGVGESKNEALRYLLDCGCEHIFLCEDDVRIKVPTVFQAYIEASQASTIPHLNFGLHGPANKTLDGTAAPVAVVETSMHSRLAFYRYPVGAFSYYHRSVLESVGLLDGFYKNYHEHVDHTLQITRKGLHPPYGWFADIEHSDDYIEDLDPELAQSTHRKSRWLFLARNYGYFLYYVVKNGMRKEAPQTEFLSYAASKNLKPISLQNYTLDRHGLQAAPTKQSG